MASDGEVASGGLLEADLRHQVFEGQLHKFTNVVKGWQWRWFVVKPEMGVLNYHLFEDGRSVGKCRGSQHLAGCIVVPSDEDSLTFNAIFASGETYKLRAANVRERQVWVDRLRAVAHLHDKAIAQTHPRHATPPPVMVGGKSQLTARGEPTESLQNLSLSVLEAFGSVHDIVHQADFRHSALQSVIERLPMTGPSPTCLDDELLMLKATSQAALLSMESSLAILQEIVEGASKKGAKSPMILSPKKTLRQQSNLSVSTPTVNSSLAKIEESSDKISMASADEQFHDSQGS